MIGPCLCGDPYCPNCGDPSQAELADAIDAMADAVSSVFQSPSEVTLFQQAGLAALNAARDLVKDEVAQARASDGEYIDWSQCHMKELEEKIETLQDRIEIMKGKEL